jgi:UDP-glucose 4-epimerase
MMGAEDILLIGGNGFIGGAVAGRLQAAGRTLHMVAPHLDPRTSPAGVHHQGCMSDPGFLAEVLPRCATIIHAASGTNPGSSARHPSFEAHRNIAPTLAMIEALDRLECFHLIYLSSGGTVYGNPDTLPATEDHPLRPLSFYAAGKIAVEAFCRVLSRPPLRTVSILRPSNVYGPGQAWRMNFGVVTNIIEHLFHEKTMEVWGDGAVVRDYLFIEDMVGAVLRLIDLRQDNGIYNIGSGRGLSLNEVIHVIEETCGKSLKVRHRPKRASDVAAIVLDNTRFGEQCGWRAKTRFEDGVAATWRWFLDQKKNA